MYRFFVNAENILEDTILVTGSDVNHIKNVLRMKIGEEILISDGNDKEYVCSILNMDDEKVEAKILDINGPGRELPIKVYLFQGLPKGDKMETVMLDAKKAANKVKRWNAISESAAKQSKRGIIPRVNDVCTFKQAIDMAKELDMIIMPYEEADDMEKTRNIIRGLKKDTSVGIFIGPEGGFAKEEVNAVMEENGTPITLGKRILRTETAGMAIMSVIMFMMEE